MKNKLNIQIFIDQHPSNWEKLLCEKPYCLEIKRDKMFGRNLILFKYNMIESSFIEKIVLECRGLVIDEDTKEVVVCPFFKFFNSREFYAAQIDWNTAVVSQKLDGSICKVVKMTNDKVLIGTMSNIDAFKAPLADQIGCKAHNFGELFLEGLAYYGLNEKMFAEMLDYNFTYIFELTSPYNQVVVKWPKTIVNFIGIRDNKTLQEQKFEDHQLADVFNTPKIYDFKNIDDCIKAANELPDNEEGYVVRDADFHRVKVKSPRYLALHRLSGNGIMTYEHAIELVRLNEIDEVVSYFPNFKVTLDEVKERYDKLISDLETSWDGFLTIVTTAAPRKEAAIWIQKNFRIPGVGFALLDNKVKDVKEWIMNVPAKNLEKALGYKV